MTTNKVHGLLLLAGGGILATSTFASDGTARSIIQLPAESRPSVELASFGIAELTPDDGAPIAAMHVRAVFENASGNRPWVFDATKARLQPVAGARLGAFAVNSDLATLPIAIIGGGERRVIDLYFALPRDVADRAGTTGFAFAWPASSREPVALAWFDRTTADVPDEPVVGSAAHWWFDPKYPWTSYYHRPGRAVPRPPRQMVVTGAPTWAMGEPAIRDGIPAAEECDEW